MFETWYALGGPERSELAKHLEPDDQGRIPNLDLIGKWMAERQWKARKDELDGRAVIIAEDNLVKQQVEMWKRHADAAAEVRLKALEYIKEHGFESSASAVQGLKWAQEEERKTRGAERYFEIVKDKSNEELIKMVRDLATRQASTESEIIDVPQEDA